MWRRGAWTLPKLITFSPYNQPSFKRKYAFTKNMFGCSMKPYETSVENRGVNVGTVPLAIGVGSHA